MFLIISSAHNPMSLFFSLFSTLLYISIKYSLQKSKEKKKPCRERFQQVTIHSRFTGMTNKAEL